MSSRAWHKRRQRNARRFLPGKGGQLVSRQPDFFDHERWLTA